MGSLSTLRFVAHFLFSHKDMNSGKYLRLLHPSISLMTTGSFYMLIITYLQSQLGATSKMDDFTEDQSQRNMISAGLLLYIATMIISRYYEAGNTIFYEMMWACNLSLFSAAYAIYQNQPLVLTASMIVVSVDQVLWFVDLLGFILFRHFPIGVAKYITWPTTSKLRLLTTFHHILFLPLCFYLLRNQHTFPIQSYGLSFGMTVIVTLLSRVLAPLKINSKGNEIYLNLNLSHELWKDVPIQMLRFTDGKPWYISATFSNLMWNTGNYILGYVLLNQIRKLGRN